MTVSPQAPDRISRIFARFHGVVAPVNETPGAPFPALDIAPAAALVREMEDVAGRNGLRLGVLWPGHDHEDAFDEGRVNAHLEKTAPGTWRVTRFDIG